MVISQSQHEKTFWVLLTVAPSWMFFSCLHFMKIFIAPTLPLHSYNWSIRPQLICIPFMKIRMKQKSSVHNFNFTLHFFTVKLSLAINWKERREPFLTITIFCLHLHFSFYESVVCLQEMYALSQMNHIKLNTWERHYSVSAQNKMMKIQKSNEIACMWLNIL